MKYNPLPGGVPKGKGLYLTEYHESSHNTDSILSGTVQIVVNLEPHIYFLRTIILFCKDHRPCISFGRTI